MLLVICSSLASSFPRSHGRARPEDKIQEVFEARARYEMDGSVRPEDLIQEVFERRALAELKDDKADSPKNIKVSHSMRRPRLLLSKKTHSILTFVEVPGREEGYGRNTLRASQRRVRPRLPGPAHHVGRVVQSLLKARRIRTSGATSTLIWRDICFNLARHLLQSGAPHT